MSTGRSARSETATTLAKLPIWAFHGAQDKVVPLEASQATIEAIAAGGDPRLTIYEDRGHDTCNVTFARDDLYEWLLQQRRLRPPGISMRIYKRL